MPFCSPQVTTVALLPVILSLIVFDTVVAFSTKAINQSSFITGMTERTPANTQQANAQQFINSSSVLAPSICLYRAFAS